MTLNDPIQTKTFPRRSRSATVLAFVGPVVLVLAALAPLGAADHEETRDEGADPSATGGTESAGDAQPEQDPCAQDGMNAQCTEFGSIRMEAHRDVRGEPLDLNAQIQLNTAYVDQGARWVMFSVRNVTDEGSSPVTIGLAQFATPSGDIVTTRVEQARPSELNVWVDVLDLPVGMPILLAFQIGVTERGAFALETLVLAFDRGYAPVKDSQGRDASLFSFTLLGVNQETGSTAGGSDGSLAEGNKLPGVGAAAALAIAGLVAVGLVRRRRA